MDFADIKKLGFGLMRLPKNGEEIDIRQTEEMVDLFLAAGFTYFDTAWAYGGSEDAIRQALVERYPREKFLLATKNAAWVKCETRQDAVAQLETSLRRTGAGYFDFYLLHNLGGDRTQVFENFGLWEWALEKKAEGKLRHLGFSFHSTAEELDRILTKHPEAEFVQLQINYADWDSPSVQSEDCYRVARKHNKPVIVMEPVKGGLLANPPASVRSIFTSAEPESSPASWAIRFAADLPGVLTVLSGMSDRKQMRDNIAAMQNFTGFTEAQRQTAQKAQKALKQVPLIPCTSCDYCAKVCPMDIGISGTFSAVNLHKLYTDLGRAKREQVWRVDNKEKKRAENCSGCGQCEGVCPQHIAIREELRNAAALLKD